MCAAGAAPETTADEPLARRSTTPTRPVSARYLLSPFAVRSAPPARQRARVSATGGQWPLWSPDGCEIFFATLQADALFAVEVSIDDQQPRLGRPVELFSADKKFHEVRQFDTVDGERFLVNVNVDGGTKTPLTLVQNWATSAKQE